MLLTIYYRNMLLLICCRSRSIQDLTMCGVFLNVKLFHDDLKLCPVDSIVSYDHKVFWSLDYIYRKIIHGILQVSQLVPGRSTLFVSYCKPIAQVTSKTLSRRVVTLLSAHASRSAASCFHAK